jgi:hypothetical protein
LFQPPWKCKKVDADGQPCTAEFATREELRRHVTAEHRGGSTHPCNHCSREFQQQSFLDAHISVGYS